MGYFVANPLGDIVTCSENALQDGIEYADSILFAQILAAPHDYKWIDEQIIHVPRPSVYHAWNGSQWLLSSQLLADARADIWEQIKVFRQERQYMGVKITVDGNDYWIHSDEPSRALHLGLVGAAILHILHMYLGVTSVPTFQTGLYWKTMQSHPNGQPIFILLDYVAALQIYAADKNVTAGCFEKAEFHRVMMENSPDPLNYNYKTGWPAVFGE